MTYNDAPGVWPVLIQGARLAGFIKRTTIHCCTQNMKALGNVVLEKIFYVFPFVCLQELMTPWVGPFLTPGAWLAGFIKRTTILCYIQNMKALGLVVSEKNFLCFSYDALGAWPVWTPGARSAGKLWALLFWRRRFFFYIFQIVSLWQLMTPMAGFIKSTTIHCYTQNMKALRLVVSKKFFLCLSHCKSMGAIDPRGGTNFDPRGMVGRIYKEDHYTLLHTKYESSWPCGFGEEKNFFFFP